MKIERLLLALLLSSTTHCSGCSQRQMPFCGEAGCFLENWQLPKQGSPATVASTSPAQMHLFGPVPMRVRIIASKNPDRFSHATFFADRPRKNTSFTWPCPGEEAELEWWSFNQSHWQGPGTLELKIGTFGTRVDLSVTTNELVQHLIPVPASACTGGVLTVTIIGAPNKPAVLFGVPRLQRTAEEPRPPVILISIDTLRADYWDRLEKRPESVQAFHDDSIRFKKVFSPTGTTHPSHRVMLSGLLLADTWNATVDVRTTIASVLRANGWDTAAFNGGGYLRPNFGFGMGQPGKIKDSAGFAYGFNTYVERMEVEGADEDRSVLPGPAFDLDLARSTYTLGVSLERSLTAITQGPGASFFHFIHGYDVHEFRDVARRFWDNARRAYQGSVDIEACAKKVGMHSDDDFVVHWSNPLGTRDRPLGELTDCHAALAALMYEARVQSVAEMLAVYLTTLRRLGVYDRALIVLTADHGESLLDERRRNGQLHWGHNELLNTNLHVPLWIKVPHAKNTGRDSDRVAGIVDVRATLLSALKLDPEPSAGIDLLAESGARKVPLELEQEGKEVGVILADGTLCTWRQPGDAMPHDLRVYDGTWHQPDANLERQCVTTRSLIRQDGSGAAPEVTDAIRDELRALGYIIE